MTDSNGTTQAEIQRPSLARKPWHYAKSQEEVAAASVRCGGDRGYVRRSYCETGCTERGSAMCTLERESATVTSEEREESASAVPEDAAAVLPRTTVDPPSNMSPRDPKDNPREHDQDAERESDGEGLIDPSEPDTNIPASDCEEGDSEDETSASETQPKPGDAPPVIEVASPAPEAEEDDCQDLEPTTTPEPLRGTSPNEGGPSEHSASPNRTDVDEEDVPDVPAPAPDVDHNEGVLELPQETDEQAPTSATSGKNLWSQLVVELGDDAIGLSVEAVSPEQITTWHKRANMLARRSVVLACAIGLTLRKRKGDLPRGKFQAWVEEHCPFSYPRAATYMRVARKIEQNYRTRHFRWQTMSIREVDRLLPSPGKKKRATKKDSAVSTKEHTEDRPPTVASPAEVDECEAADGDTSAITATTVDSADTAVAPLDVEAALALLTEEIEASPDPQARAVELIERLATVAEVGTHATRRIILLRPVARGSARRRVSRGIRKVSGAALVAETESKPHRTLRFGDLVSGRCAGT